MEPGLRRGCDGGTQAAAPVDRRGTAGNFGLEVCERAHQIPQDNDRATGSASRAASGVPGDTHPFEHAMQSDPRNPLDGRDHPLHVDGTTLRQQRKAVGHLLNGHPQVDLQLGVLVDFVGTGEALKRLEAMHHIELGLASREPAKWPQQEHQLQEIFDGASQLKGKTATGFRAFLGSHQELSAQLHAELDTVVVVFGPPHPKHHGIRRDHTRGPRMATMPAHRRQRLVDREVLGHHGEVVQRGGRGFKSIGPSSIREGPLALGTPVKPGDLHVLHHEALLGGRGHRYRKAAVVLDATRDRHEAV